MDRALCIGDMFGLVDYSWSVLEVVFPLVPLLILILFDTLAESSGIGGAGCPVLNVFGVELMLANGVMTL